MLLKKLFSEIGADIRGFFAEIRAGGLKIALLHGHDEELLQSLVKSGTYDLVVYGHTHQVSVKQEGRTMVVNPGEACGYLSGKSTMAILKVGTRDVETVTL